MDGFVGKHWVLLPRLLLLVAGLACISSTPVRAKDRVTPLFASDELLTVELAGPIKTIAKRAAKSIDPQDAVLQANGETHNIALSARGVSRRKRENCVFPPLRIRFAEKPSKGSLFHKQRSIKLVTHCKDKDRNEQVLLREYATYRLYNLMTPESLKVRLARLRYRDGETVVAERYGFFIEDIDDAARRLGGKEIDIPRTSVSALSVPAAARYTLFQYMIGNTDWAMIAGPPGSDCCHNSKLVGQNKAARSDLIPVPYDFDNAGIVNAPYAVPADVLPIRSVRQRYYRGHCRMNEAVKQAVPEFLSRRAAVEGEIASITVLSEDSRKQMRAYLGEFFDQVQSADSIDRKLFKTCR
ncbi:hypothetical protein SAMN02745824_0039 [Parasphingorhabdus marina DSM 22363]|uniref:Uncharacterized protein n=1 Tax=Parasphingorhabdus marina DSM 22363 TaxID=1123272 RepID=A0A1N6CLU0_9SPHN|nr:hypothetical protein [Parasphingorhabdus marina]SIN59511.1 hypothetical protein SAMN02745824_0039 [Parasphingorhabdus marina DSM 22363]